MMVHSILEDYLSEGRCVHYLEVSLSSVEGVGAIFHFAFLPQDKFLPFIDLFQKEDVKVEICKTVVRAFTMYVRQTATRVGSL